nr:MAG TPA: hypothetical protein [Caudoviricetes sp.]
MAKFSSNRFQKMLLLMRCLILEAIFVMCSSMIIVGVRHRT